MESTRSVFSSLCDHKHACPISGSSMNPENLCHRLPGRPPTNGLLSHSLVCQHPKDDSVSSNFWLDNQFSKVWFPAFTPFGVPGSYLGHSPSQHFPSPRKSCWMRRHNSPIYNIGNETSILPFHNPRRKESFTSPTRPP